jgi:transcription elongation factor GreA-like protein
MVIHDFDANIFLKEGVKVDVKFDKKFWYCGEVQKVTKTKQVLVSFVNEDESIRMKPAADEIRLCSHEPQLKSFSL